MTVVETSRSTCECERSDWRYAGLSSEPHDRCGRPYWLVCRGCGARVNRRCSRSSRAACEPCAETYRRNVRRVFLSGWSDKPLERVWVLTLTAPGSRAHRRGDGRWCGCTPAGGVHL